MNLVEYLTAKYTKVITEMAEDLGGTADEVSKLKTIISALKNSDMMVNGVSLTLDMVQVMENGDVRIMPPPPIPPITEVCVQEPEKNGKKPETAKEPTNAN